jgi:hypothetical protein
MIDVSALMPLQNACGGPLSPPDTFFDLCIAFLPVSGKSISSPFWKKTLLSCFGKIIFFLIFRKNCLRSLFREKDAAENALR